jgi:hypothetical protein
MKEVRTVKRERDNPVCFCFFFTRRFAMPPDSVRLESMDGRKPDDVDASSCTVLP